MLDNEAFEYWEAEVEEISFRQMMREAFNEQPKPNCFIMTRTQFDYWYPKLEGKI